MSLPPPDRLSCRRSFATLTSSSTSFRNRRCRDTSEASEKWRNGSDNERRHVRDECNEGRSRLSWPGPSLPYPRHSSSFLVPRSGPCRPGACGGRSESVTRPFAALRRNRAEETPRVSRRSSLSVSSSPVSSRCLRPAPPPPYPRPSAFPPLTLPFPLILHSPRVSPAERAAFGRTRGEWGWGREKDTERNDQRE